MSRLFTSLGGMVAALFMAMAIVACSTAKRPQPIAQPTVAIEFSADTAYQLCAAQCGFGPRVMNSSAHEMCGQWIADRFRGYGYQVELQQATLRGYDGTMLKATNIIAHGDTTANSRVLICAHWDSRPWADNDADSAQWHKPVMAANDGASGVAVMLELARLIKANDSLAVGVDFVCFDAEDWGIPQWSDAEEDGNSWALGAQYWAAHPTGGNYRYAVLLDMVGGQGAHFYQEGYSMQHARSVVERVWAAAAAAGYGSFFVHSDSGYITDDHVPLNEVANIPTIDIINCFPDCEQSSFGPTWHTASDDMTHISRETLQAVGQTLVQLLYTEQ